MFRPQSIRLRKVLSHVTSLNLSSILLFDFSNQSLCAGCTPARGSLCFFFPSSAWIVLPNLSVCGCVHSAAISMRLLCVSVCAWVYHIFQVHQTSQNWSLDSCELPCWGSELNSGSLREQPTLFPTQPFPQSSLIFSESLSKVSLLSHYVSLFPSPVFLLNTLLLCGTQYILYTGLSVPFLSHQNACSANYLFVLFRYVAILFLKTSRWHAVELK